MLAMRAWRGGMGRDVAAVLEGEIGGEREPSTRADGRHTDPTRLEELDLPVGFFPFAGQLLHPEGGLELRHGHVESAREARHGWDFGVDPSAVGQLVFENLSREDEISKDEGPTLGEEQDRDVFVFRAAAVGIDRGMLLHRR